MLKWYIAGGIGLFALGVTVGATVNGWRYEAKISAMTEQNAEALAETHQKAEKLSQRLSLAAAEHVKQLNEANHANQLLADAVARDSVRLRVKANCLPKTPSSGVVDNGASPELDRAARSDYFALREGIIVTEAKLRACQDIIRKERE